MLFVGVLLQGVMAGSAEATQCSQAFPNRHQKCPHGAESNMSVELSFNRRLAASALMFLFDGSLCCIMGCEWGWQRGLKRVGLRQLHLE